MDSFWKNPAKWFWLGLIGEFSNGEEVITSSFDSEVAVDSDCFFLNKNFSAQLLIAEKPSEKHPLDQGRPIQNFKTETLSIEDAYL